MRVIPLTQINYEEVHLTSLFSMFQSWNSNNTVIMDNPRPSSAFVYFRCYADYISQSGLHLTASPGDVIYLPQGSQYHSTFNGTRPDSFDTILINFQIMDCDDDFFVFSDDIEILSIQKDNVEYNVEYIENMFTKIASLYESPSFSMLLLKSYIYRVLADLNGIKRNSSLLNAKQYKNIAKGIQYLEDDHTQDISIDKVAAMCNVSSNYFRKLFKQYAGVSPVDFRINRKIDRAKKLLEIGILNITEISVMLDFNDVAYFSRLFKQKVGLSPLQYSNCFCTYKILDKPLPDKHSNRKS